MKGLLFVGAMVALTAASVASQALDPFTGTWTLNIAKSTMTSATTASKSETVTYTHANGEEIYASDAVTATGEAEIGLQQLSELMSNPNVEVIGLLPDSLQQITINAAGITSVAKEPDAARALIRHLATPEALAIYKGKGLGL